MSEEKKLILASRSPRRQQLLKAAGYRFDVVAPEVDEPELPGDRVMPQDMAQALAYFKARWVADRSDDHCVVLGADTLVALNKTIYGKADSVDQARAYLKTLSHNQHCVITGVAIIDTSNTMRILSCAQSTVTMRAMSDDEIDAYIATAAWKDKAGAYALQEGGDKFIEIIDGSETNVIGLPMELLEQVLPTFEIHPGK